MVIGVGVGAEMRMGVGLTPEWNRLAVAAPVTTRTTGLGDDVADVAMTMGLGDTLLTDNNDADETLFEDAASGVFDKVVHRGFCCSWFANGSVIVDAAAAIDVVGFVHRCRLLPLFPVEQ